jgi:hypothetical protein
VRCVPAVDEITHSWVYDFDTVLDLPCTLQGKSFSKPLTFTDLAPMDRVPGQDIRRG